MGKSNIKATLDELSKTDIYSLMLFALWKIHDIPEYSTLSELSYILDSDNFMKFLRYYEGKTIKVPTRDEFLEIVNALLIYNMVNLEEVPLSEAIASIDPNTDVKSVKETYYKLCDILDKYDFKRN